MSSLNRLRFKIVTSFTIAFLGAVAFVRLADIVPMSLSTLTSFIVPGILVVAGLWRACIYLQTLKSTAKT